MSSAVPRQRTTVRGDVASVVGTDRPWMRTDVTMRDDTGSVLLRFVGRSSVPGIEVGRRLVVEGTPGLVDGDLVMLNPVYSFASSADED
jgi:hypothetical protein